MPTHDQPRSFTATVAVHIKAEQSGQLPRFDMVAYTGEPMEPDGWYGRIVVDLDGVRVRNQHRPILRQHDHEKIVGHSESVQVTPRGIEVSGVLSNRSSVHAQEILTLAKNGFQWQASIGATPTRTEYLEAGETTTVNNREVHGPCTIARETDIGEISFVPLGADPSTSVHVTATKGRSAMFEKAALKLAAKSGIAAAKFTEAEIDEMTEADARANLKKCMAADKDERDEKKEDEEEKKTEARIAQSLAAATQKGIEAARKMQVAEIERVTQIRARVTAHGITTAEIDTNGTKSTVDLASHAISAGWTPDQTEFTALRCARPGAGVGVPGGLGYSTSTPVVSDAVMEAAIFQAMGGSFKLFDDEFYARNDDGHRRVSHYEEKRITSELKARYTDQVQQAAHTMFRSRIGLQQALTMIAGSNGYRGGPVIRDELDWGNVAGYLQASPQRIQADGASTISIANVLANVQNKFMLQGYLFTEQAFMELAMVRPVKDFKPTKNIALFGDFKFRDLGTSGEIQHATLNDQAFSNQALLRARMITIPLQHIVNDDLGMLGQVPQLLGRGWGLEVNDLFWKVYMNPGNDEGGTTAFYAAVHTIAGQQAGANLSTGTGSALNSAGLQAGKVMFDKQIDPAGFPLGVDAEILAYPPELDVAAIELMNAQYIIMAGLASTTAGSKQPNTNIWKGRFKPVMSRYLSNTAYVGNSATAWYLQANPAIIPVIEIAAWNGVMTPTVQTAGQDWQFNILGITMRGYGAVGVNAQNFRGGVKSAGV